MDSIPEKQYNYFYKTTNLLNGKFYYGIHSTDRLNDGYLGSGNALKKSIKKHGSFNFQKEILAYFPTRKELAEYEKLMVNEQLAKDKMCYNLRSGGDGYTTEQMIEVSKQFSGENNPFYGKTHPPEIKKIISEKGKRRFQNEDVWNKGLTKETSESLRRAGEKTKGENHHTFRNPVSEETRNKISQSSRGHKKSKEFCLKLKNRMTGENHPNFGKNLTESQKKSISTSNPKNKPCSIDGVIYYGIREAARSLNLSNNTVDYRLKSKTDTFSNWFFVK